MTDPFILRAVRNNEPSVVAEHLPNQSDGTKERMLCVAAREGSADVAEVLIENLSEGAFSSNALHNAAFNDHHAIMDQLSSVIDVRGLKTDDLTSIISNASALTVARLIQLGVDPDKTELLRRAVELGHSETAHVLLDEGADPRRCVPSLLFEALSERDASLIEALVEAGAKPRDPRGNRTLVEYVEQEEHPDSLLTVFRALRSRCFPFSVSDMGRMHRVFPEHHDYIVERMRPRERKALFYFYD